jgi:uncharacterized protein YybS (DUF2232 family)
MPFDNLSGIKTKKYNIWLFILLTFLALMATLFIPGLGLLAAVLLPVPASLMIIMGRIRDGIICAAVPCLILFLFGYILPPVMIAFIAAVAFSYRYAVENRWPAWRTIGAVFASFVGAVVIYLILYMMFYGFGSLSEISGTYYEYIESMGDDPFFSSYASMIAIEGAELDAVLAQTQSVLMFLPRILPGILAVSFAIISLVNYLVSCNIFKRNQIEIKPFKPFIAWDLPWYYVWGVILGLILVLIPKIGGTIDGSPAFIDQAFDVLGFNLVIIFGSLYAVLGISALWGIFARFKLGLLIRVIIIAALWFFFGIALFVFPLLGLIDIWANFRKLKRE